MPEFELREAKAPHRRVGSRFTAAVDPGDEEACLALLRTQAKHYGRKPSEVLLRVDAGRRVMEYRA